MKNGDNTKGKITITTNKASVLNASTINNKFIAIDKAFISKGNLLSLEGWFRVHVLCEQSGKSIKAFSKDAEKNTTWKASTIENRVQMIRWALSNIKTEGKKAVMFIDSEDKFRTVVDSMEQIVVTRYPAQKTSEKVAKKTRTVSVVTIDASETRKRVSKVRVDGKPLAKNVIDAIVSELMKAGE